VGWAPAYVRSVNGVAPSGTDGAVDLSGTFAPLAVSGCSLANSADQAGIATATFTAVTFNDEAAPFFDAGGYHESVTNPSRITIPASLGGKFAVKAAAILGGLGADKQGIITLYKNGTEIKGARRYFSSPYVGADVSVMVALDLELAAGDYIQAFIQHNHGSNRDVYGGGVYSATFSAIRRGT
jgi:hypothetical protein